MNRVRAALTRAWWGVGTLTFAALDMTVRGISMGRQLTTMVFSRMSGPARYFLPRTRFDYQREVDPGANSIVVACMSWISRNFPDAPIKITQELPDGTIEPVRASSSGPGAMLRLLERPNPVHSGVLLWMATLLDFLQGNGYWYKRRGGDPTGSGYAAAGRVVELWWLPASQVEPRSDPGDPSVFISHYEYRVDGGVWVIPPEDIVHFRQGLDPINPRKGRSQLASLFREIFTDDEAANMTASLMRNMGVPGVVIAPANTSTVLIRKPDEVSQKFSERFGGDARGGVMTFSQPMEIKQMSWNPQQMDLRALRRIPEERVSAVTGVPAIVAGLGAGLDRSTFSNFGEARRAAYTEGVITLHRLIAAELEVQLLPDFGGFSDDGYDVQFDWTKASAMQESLDALWGRMKGPAVSGLITRADFRRAVNLPVAGDGSDDVYVMPNNYLVVPAQGAIPPAGLPPGRNLPQLAPGAPTGSNGNGRHAAIGAAP